jgi:hypothetical protein
MQQLQGDGNSVVPGVRLRSKNQMKKTAAISKKMACSFRLADGAAFTLCKVRGERQMLWHIQENKRNSFGPYNSTGRARYPA